MILLRELSLARRREAADDAIIECIMSQMTKSPDQQLSSGPGEDTRRERTGGLRRQRMNAGERRKQFIAAAKSVITREGMIGATTRAIADEAGAPLASLHYVFASKDDLLRCVVEEGTRPLAEAGENDIDLDRGVSGVMLSYAEFHWRLVADPAFERSQLEIMLWALRRPGHEDLAELMYSRWVSAFEELFRTAAERAGENPPPTQVHLLARSYLAILDGVTLQYMADGLLDLARSQLNDLILMLVARER